MLSTSFTRYDTHWFSSLTNALRFDKHFATRKVASGRPIDDELMFSDVFEILAKRPWNSLFSFHAAAELIILVSCSAELIILVSCTAEFYCNMQVNSAELFTTYVSGKNIAVSPSSLVEFLSIEKIDEPDYSPSDDEFDPLESGLYIDLAIALTGGQVHEWHKDIDLSHARLLFSIGGECRITVPGFIFKLMLKTSRASGNAILPYGVLSTQLLMKKNVTRKAHDITMPIGSHINIWSLKQSSAHTNWSPAVGHANVTDKVRNQLPPQAEGAQSSLADQITSLEGVVRKEFCIVHEDFIDLYVRLTSIDKPLAALVTILHHK